MPDSNPEFPLKTKILDWIAVRFRQVVAREDGADNPYYVEYSVVSREPLTDNQIKGKKRVMGVYAGQENKAQRSYPLKNVELDLIIEVHVFNEANISLTRELEVAIAEVERILMEDPTCGGLATDIVLDGNQSEPEGRWDNYGQGAVLGTIKYSHHQDDPRKAGRA